MQKEYLEFLDTVKLCLHNEDAKTISSERWNSCFAELMNQCIVPIVAGKVGADAFGANSMNAMGVFCSNLRVYHEICTEQDKLSSILESKGISFAILKGMTAAKYYKNPEHRTMGDIDLIIESSRFHEAVKLFEEGGFGVISTLEVNPRHVVMVSKSGLHVEPHIKFSSSNNEAYNSALDEFISNGLKRTSVVTVSGHNVRVLPELENGIILLGHINQHLSSGLGLRQIIDWMYYVENVLTDEFWNSTFKDVADKISLVKLAKIATCMCKKYLGLESDATWYMDLMGDSLVDELTEFIMSHGNFGRKDSSTNRSVTVIRMFRNPIKGLKTAQSHGLITWNALKKHPWLKPFAWAYQICRWISHGIKGGVKVSDIKSISDKEKVERDFLERLEISRL